MNRITYTIILSFFLVSMGWSQDLTYKEVKTIEKTIPCTTKNLLSISGERTFINLSTWDKDYVSAKINVISKFTDKTQASNDLEKINVVLEKSGKKIIYSNALRIKSPADKPKSHLSVSVDLRVPRGLKVAITNAFGEIEISGDYKQIESVSDFSAINIYDFTGDGDFKTKYGDISIDGYDGELNIEADRSNLMMERVTGKTKVEASYGELEIYYPKKSAFYNVNAAYSPISLYIMEEYSEAIAITCKECSVEGKDDNLPLRITGTGEEINAELSKIKGTKPTSLISSKLENVTIKSYKSKSKNN